MTENKIEKSDVKTLTSSGSYTGTEVEKLFDGNVDTYWNSYKNDSAGNTFFLLEFFEPKRISLINIRNISAISASAGTYGLRDYTISVSNNGIDFIIVYNGSNENRFYDEFPIELNLEESYKYLRFEALNSWASGKKVLFGEFEMFLYTPIKRMILKNPTTNQLFSLAEKTLIFLPSALTENVIKHGIVSGEEINMAEDFDKITTVNADGTTTTTTVTPFSVYDYISEKPQLVVYTELTDDISVTTTVKPHSVYNYITENPQVIAYTELTDDIIVSTTTEPYDLYDEFGNQVEVLYYTNDESVKEADLILEANWSPIDELEGDFEVVTWTDEPQETAQRVLELTAIPQPQFIKLVNPKRLYGYLDDVLAVDASISYRDEIRYLFTDEKATKWHVWNFDTKKFVEVDASTHELISKNGMKHDEVALLTQNDWRTWSEGKYINIGIFLKDNPRDTITSVVDSVSYQDYLPRDTVELEKANFYILNTKARIDISIEGNTVKGVLSDDDLTRVQYRILLNEIPYYPKDGSFTALSAPPNNIELAFDSNDILIDDWNSVKVEFRDFFGTVDYWQTNFIGTYAGLMFKDIHGDYYSNDIGEILKYLDFGVIVAGQTTIEHEIILKNQYGYDVNNIHLYANTSEFPIGMSLEFSKSLSPFIPESEIKLSDVFKNNDEMSFFVRIGTDLIATPNANGVFDIIVRADKV